MIPLMMQEGFKATGWLVSAPLAPLVISSGLDTLCSATQGLILGTRMYYAFFDEAVATDEAFTQQMDSLTRGTLYVLPRRLIDFLPNAIA